MKAGREYNLVMIVDDDMFIRKVLKKAVESLAQVVEVWDGVEVEKTYRDYNPDIVFLDIHLPNYTGIELLEKIMAIDPKAYVVMLSADSTEENVKIATGKGAVGFMAKPIDKERVLHHFRKCPTVMFMDS